MKKLFLIAAWYITSAEANAQTYNDSIYEHIRQYKQEFLTEERSPLKAADTGYLRFYDPNEKYRVTAKIELTPGAEIFEMPTHSGKTKTFRQYGLLHFLISGKPYTLQIFQNIGLLKDPKHKDHLFIPFTDKTTYEETYGGGRYIDLLTTDIINGEITLDFNKAYNPYCAYAGGYNCPIPPKENRLNVAVKAAEKMFTKPVKE